jgi:7-cyano-7-deazaguanine synthase
MQKTFDLYTDGMVNISTPFIDWKKNEIYNYTKKNKIPVHLTYSCELGEKQPCGKCKSCKDLEYLYAKK